MLEGGYREGLESSIEKKELLQIVPDLIKSVVPYISDKIIRLYHMKLRLVSSCHLIGVSSMINLTI